jgi:hypothetical protein
VSTYHMTGREVMKHMASEENDPGSSETAASIEA